MSDKLRQFDGEEIGKLKGNFGYLKSCSIELFYPFQEGMNNPHLGATLAESSPT